MASAKSNPTDLGLLVADNVNAMLAYWDKNQVCMFANNAYREWLGKTREEMVGRTMKEILGPLYEQNLPFIREVLAGKPQSFEREIRVPSGELRYSIANYYPDISNGEVRGFFVHAADITSIKKLEIELKQAKNNLQTLADRLIIQNNQLANFAHITSHNLRAPVSNLNSLLHFYQQSESEQDKALIFAKFEKVIQHLSSTLNELVEALKIKETSNNKEKETVYFEDVLVKTKEIMTGQIMETGALITSDFSKAPKIECHRGYMESIMLNLLNNAIKYRSPERVPVINIVTDRLNAGILISVSDNGLGIDLDLHGHNLFGLHKTFHPNAEAKGVGLFITKTQVEAMDGTITASSEVDKGTTFEIRFNTAD